MSLPRTNQLFPPGRHMICRSLLAQLAATFKPASRRCPKNQQNRRNRPAELTTNTGALTLGMAILFHFQKIDDPAHRAAQRAFDHDHIAGFNRRANGCLNL